MALEIERKFLLRGEGWKGLGPGVFTRQGYIPSDAGRTVRVRIAGDEAFLTIKGKTHGISRSEFEYPIPIDDARQLLEELCEPPIVEKTRYRLEIGGHIWEVDQFHGENDGLILAEVELDSPDEHVELPDWIGEEVSADPRYRNRCLAKKPFKSWR